MLRDAPTSILMCFDHGYPKDYPCPFIKVLCDPYHRGSYPYCVCVDCGVCVVCVCTFLSEHEALIPDVIYNGLLNKKDSNKKKRLLYK